MEGKKVKVNHTAIVSSDAIETVKMIADGMTLQEIADMKGTTKSTLATHVQFLKGRLGCSSLPNLVAYFLRNKLID